jgi:predicted Zn-dependent peptidase
MILSVVSGLPLPELRRSVETSFGALPAAAAPPIAPTPPAAGPAEVTRPQEKAQVALLAARALPPAAALPDEVEVLVDVLSARLGLELRETQGLAYSVGAGLGQIPGLAPGEAGFSLVTLQIATAAENRERARSGLRAELERLAAQPPGEGEVFRAVNGRWGRELMRDLARIHQAYRLGLREHLGLAPFAADAARVARQRAAGPARLAELTRQYLLQDDWIWALAGGGLQ